MPYETGIVGALQRYGLDVDVADGWKTRGSSSFNPAGVVGHHTAGPKTGDRPSLEVCIYGRPDLSGPLCNVFLPRGLTPAQQAPVVVAAGRANHAGEGSFRGLTGNSSVFGIEAEDDGTDGIWTDWQLWAYPRVVAGLLWLASQDESWYCAHRTWAPDRKIDPTGISDSWMQSQVHDVFHPPTPEEIMAKVPFVGVAAGQTTAYLVDAAGKRRIPNPDIRDYFINTLELAYLTNVPAGVLNLYPTLALDANNAAVDAATVTQQQLTGISAQLNALAASVADDPTAEQVAALAEQINLVALDVSDDATAAQVADLQALVEATHPAP